jgi:hypothetical protein
VKVQLFIKGQDLSAFETQGDVPRLGQMIGLIILSQNGSLQWTAATGAVARQHHKGCVASACSSLVAFSHWLIPSGDPPGEITKMDNNVKVGEAQAKHGFI